MILHRDQYWEMLPHWYGVVCTVPQHTYHTSLAQPTATRHESLSLEVESLLPLNYVDRMRLPLQKLSFETFNFELTRGDLRI